MRLTPELWFRTSFRNLVYQPCWFKVCGCVFWTGLFTFIRKLEFSFHKSLILPQIFVKSRMNNIAGFSKSQANKLAKAIRERENNEVHSEKCPRLDDSALVSSPDSAKNDDYIDDDQVAPDQDDYDDNIDDFLWRQVGDLDFADAVCDEDDLDELLSDTLFEDHESPFLKDLRKWALSSRIARVHVNSLLKLLNKHYGSIFPKDSRTLLKTPRKPTIAIPMAPGEYYHITHPTHHPDFLNTPSILEQHDLKMVPQFPLDSIHFIDIGAGTNYKCYYR